MAIAEPRYAFDPRGSSIHPDPQLALVCCVECGNVNLAIAKCDGCRICPTCKDPARYCTCHQDAMDWWALTPDQERAEYDRIYAAAVADIVGDLVADGMDPDMARELAETYLSSSSSPFADAPHPDMGDPYP